MCSEFASHGLHALPVACEELDSDDYKAECNVFELICLLVIFHPPCEDTKQTIEDALAFGVKVKMVTGPHPGGWPEQEYLSPTGPLPTWRDRLSEALESVVVHRLIITLVCPFLARHVVPLPTDISCFCRSS